MADIPDLKIEGTIDSVLLCPKDGRQMFCHSAELPSNRELSNNLRISVSLYRTPAPKKFRSKLPQRYQAFQLIWRKFAAKSKLEEEGSHHNVI